MEAKLYRDKINKLELLDIQMDDVQLVAAGIKHLENKETTITPVMEIDDPLFL